jgi:hypothetical protein
MDRASTCAHPVILVAGPASVPDFRTRSAISLALLNADVRQLHCPHLFEFVMGEDLAARIAAMQKATISETASGNIITASVSPHPSAPDAGKMTIELIIGGTQIIENACSLVRL